MSTSKVLTSITQQCQNSLQVNCKVNCNRSVEQLPIQFGVNWLVLSGRKRAKGLWVSSLQIHKELDESKQHLQIKARLCLSETLALYWKSIYFSQQRTGHRMFHKMQHEVLFYLVKCVFFSFFFFFVPGWWTRLKALIYLIYLWW